ESQLASQVWLFGYRRGYSDGYRVHGTLRLGQNLNDVGMVYNLETSLPDRSSVGGMSGAPVVDPKRALVVGIQYGEEDAGPAISYVHPIEKVYVTWPTLAMVNAAATAGIDVLDVPRALASSLESELGNDAPTAAARLLESLPLRKVLQHGPIPTG